MIFPKIIVLLFLTTAASAGSTEIAVTGKVIAAPCIVNSDTANKVIEFPKTEARSMADSGSSGEWVSSVLELDNCPVYLQSVVAKFSGVPDVHDGTTYKNGGNAENVALQLSSVATATNYGDGSTMMVDVDPATHKAFFPLAARIYSPTGNAGVGSFSVVVCFEFSYQ